MVERSELEQRVRRMVSADITYRVLKSLGERGIRRLDKRAAEIVGLLKYEEETKKREQRERFYADVKEIDEEEKARTLRQGIDTFKEEHPKYGEILENLIQETRENRNKYLIYGIQPGYNLSEEDHLQIFMDLGFERREASSLYPHILAISQRLKKANEQAERRILIG